MAFRNARDQTVASVDFAKLAQGILHQRFVRACVYELAFAYMVGVFASVNLSRGLLSLPFALLSFRTLAYTAVSYVIGIAVLFLHVHFFQVTRATYGSHFPRLQRLLRNPTNTGMVVGTYVVLSQAVFVVHGWMFGGRNTYMWLYPEGQHGPPQLNPGWLASWVLATALGAGYGAQLVMDERLQLTFPSVEQNRVYALKDRVPTSVSRAFAYASSLVSRFWAVYFIFGWGVYRTVCGILAHLTTTTYSYGVGNPLFSLGGVVFWLHSSTLTVLTWELAHQLFEVIATEPTHINKLSSDSNRCLVNGLKHAGNELIQHLAYQELYRLAEFSSEQRSDIFADIDRPNGTMWKQVSTQCIGVIRAATSQLQAQHKAATAAKSSAKKAEDTASAAPKPAQPTTPLRKVGGAPMRDIFQKNLKDSTTAIEKPKTPTVSTQELFEPEAQGLEKYVLTMLRDTLVQSKLGQRVLTYSLRARSTTAFANFQLQVWAVRSLVRLVERSLEEDRYGVVQGDITAILETLFAYLAALEKCLATLDSGNNGVKAFNVQTTARQPLMMAQVVRNSIYIFTTSFYVHLESMKLSPELGRKLQPFADFKA
ncbi:Nuclear pore complex subunit [Coemansia sp. RSA 1722]|nr:Nuclear pore complex subunit [Coemansia sp. RSA 486]KAJ2226526.1 Nuclear pore complex subunit [Coemansia sp. RSA 485]KAJ2591999.1 Nuclear pore complex subunit [Coemansia sp. RSA 1722]